MARIFIFVPVRFFGRIMWLSKTEKLSPDGGTVARYHATLGERAPALPWRQQRLMSVKVTTLLRFSQMVYGSRKPRSTLGAA